MLKHLTLGGWRQFADIELAFHDRLTVLTGANGAGKTTILHLIGQHFGWNLPLVSTPRRKSAKGKLDYFSGIWNFLTGGSDIPSGQQKIGSLEYADGHETAILAPENVSSTFRLNLHHQRDLSGLHIPSHRPQFQYAKLANIPTEPKTREQVFQQYSNLVRNRYRGASTRESPHYYIKETLISWATFGFSNQVVSGNPEFVELFDSFEQILRTVLPKQLGFQKLSIRIPEVVLETDSGDFSLDAVSGGIASIIDMAWNIFIYSPTKEEYIVTIDEPENHLHPQMQRAVLRDLIVAFPHVQFLVATHNPFIVGSVPNSNVYVLEFDDERKVKSRFLKSANRSGTSNEILREVLGVSLTMPIWVEDRLQEIIDRYTSVELSTEQLSQLRSELEEIGLGQYVPETMARVVKKERDSD